MIKPKKLSAGARVSLVAAAGPLAEGAVDRAIALVESLGWTPLVGRHSRLRHGYLAGTDAERLADLQEALDSDENDAIWLLRGGYGAMRILPQLQLEELRRRPRPLIGFSDNTVLHLEAQRQQIVTFHGPHAAAASMPPFSLSHLMRQITRGEAPGLLDFPAGGDRAATLVSGVARGKLTGGNLSLLAATVGTPYQLAAEGKILFIEEVGEPVYRVDRMLTQLILSGALDGVAGIALGAFSDCPDEGSPGVPATSEVLLDRLGPLGVPVASCFPFGHIDESWTLPLGIEARLDASLGTLELLESAVSS